MGVHVHAIPEYLYIVYSRVVCCVYCILIFIINMTLQTLSTVSLFTFYLLFTITLVHPPPPCSAITHHSPPCSTITHHPCTDISPLRARTAGQSVDQSRPAVQPTRPSRHRRMHCGGGAVLSACSYLYPCTCICKCT